MKKSTKSRKPDKGPYPVTGRKILRNGELGAPRTFPSARAAGMKVAPDSDPDSARKQVNKAALGRIKSAYGYVWSY